MTTQVNAMFWKEFIAIFKSHPAIWNRKERQLYTNRQLKKCAYAKLLKKLREEIPHATLETLKRKLNTLRGCYRRELKKVLMSEKLGFNLYVPTLWYFEQLSFLRFHETKTVDNKNANAVANDEDFAWEETTLTTDEIGGEEDNDETILAMYESPNMSADEGDHDETLEGINENDFNESSAKKARRDSDASIEESLTKCASSNTSSCRISVVPQEHIAATTIAKPQIRDDDASTLSAAWTVLFRKLTPEQQLYANQTIMGVLYQGALGNLHEFSYKILENSHENY